MSEPRSFAGFFFAALRHKKRGTFWRLRRSKKTHIFPLIIVLSPLKLPFSKKVINNLLFYPQTLCLWAFRPLFPSFLSTLFPQAFGRGGKGQKTPPKTTKIRQEKHRKSKQKNPQKGKSVIGNFEPSKNGKVKPAVLIQKQHSYLFFVVAKLKRKK